MQTKSFMLRFLYSYNGNTAHFQGEEAGKSSSRREKAHHFAFENENGKSLCSSNFITSFLKGNLPMGKT